MRHTDSISTTDPATGPTLGCPRQALLVYGDTNNLGDEIQSVAVQRLLSDVDALVDRDRLSAFNPEDRIPRRIVLNGWYSGGPENWPPSEYLEPLLISMHISGTPAYHSGLRGVDVMLAEPLAEYLRYYAPVGARDLSTMRLLNRTKIESYFSGCATLTLPRSTEARDEDVLVLNDVPPEAAALIKGRTKKRIIETSHVGFYQGDPNRRLQRARELLEVYRGAGCVVTSRLHCALPSMAMGTPTLLLDVASDQHRFEGLNDLLHHCSLQDFLAGKAPFDPEQPVPTLDRHFEMAEALKDRIRSFITAPSRAIGLTYPLTDRQRLEGVRLIQQLLIQRIDGDRRHRIRVSAAHSKLLEALKKMAGLEKNVALNEEQQNCFADIEHAAADLKSTIASY
jgi:Polysaccharide pyruvyl transferase